MWSTPLALAFGTVLFAQDAHAFFRMPCKQPVVVERADPIVNPDAVSGHLHTIMGGSGFDFNMTFDNARASSCSSCMARADLSNYWTPAMFFRGQNGSFHRVEQLGGMTVYYLQRRGSDDEQLHAFPPDFRMLAGSPVKRSYNASDPAQAAVSHMCLDYTGVSVETPGFPASKCPDGLRTQIFFPSCWNGQDLDSPDHKSHVAYPSGVNSGTCPSSHPVRLVSIFYEIIWEVDKWADQWWSADGLGHPLTLSNGDPTGFGFHGDFVNGWDVDVLQLAVDQCTNDSGVIEDCGLLQLRTDDEMGDCAMAARVSDDINGWIERLPGCNDVTAGPADAAMQPPSACGAPTDMLPKDVSLITPVPGWTTLGCAYDDQGNRVLGKQYKNGAMTPDACTSYCAANGFTYAGLEFASECYCGNAVDQSRLAVGEGACNMACEGDANASCGGTARLAVYQMGGAAPAPSQAPIPTSDPTPSSSSPTATSTPTETVPPPVPTDTEPSTSTPIPTSDPTLPPPASSSPTATSTPTETVAPPASTESPTPTSTPTPGTPSTTDSPSSSTDAPASTETATPSSTETDAPSSTDAGVPEPTASGSGFPSPDANWDSLGCYVDPLNPRALTGMNMWNGLPMTAAVCVQHCQDNNFAYAGTEWGGECYCGAELSDGTIQAPDGDCSKACDGDASAVCGGPGRLNLYKLKDGITPPGPGATQPTTPDSDFPAPSDGWDSLGCWFDPVVPRALSAQRFTDDSMTPEKCVAGCESRGFVYAGTEFGGECYCANEVLAAMKVAATDCATQCKGDASLVCGAPGRLNLYRKAGASSPDTSTDSAPAATATTTLFAPGKKRRHHQPAKRHARRRRFNTQRMS